MSKRWQLQGSLTLSRSTGNLGNSFGKRVESSGLFLNPNNLTNAYGPLDMDAPVQIKAQGTYVAPFDIFVSPNYTGISGSPIITGENFPADTAGAYTIRFTRANSQAIIVESAIDLAGEPRGTHRFPFNPLAFRAEKKLRFNRYELGLIADVFNVLNINSVVAMQTLRYDLPNFLRPSRIELPRTLRVGARFAF